MRSEFWKACISRWFCCCCCCVLCLLRQTCFGTMVPVGVSMVQMTLGSLGSALATTGPGFWVAQAARRSEAQAIGAMIFRIRVPLTADLTVDRVIFPLGIATRHPRRSLEVGPRHTV